MICYEASNGSITFDERRKHAVFPIYVRVHHALTVSICALFLENMHYMPLNAISAKTLV